MSNTLRNGLTALLAVGFVAGALLFALRLYDRNASAEAAAAAQELAAAPSEAPLVEELVFSGVPAPEAPGTENSLLFELDLEALRETAPQVLGWICIPDTVIDYPLMAFDDNEAGLNRAWDGTKNSAGCIFLECKNQRDLSDFNTLVYGHNMRDGSMFGSLKQYARQEYLEAHPCVYIVTDDAVRRYEVFSAYEASVTSDTYRLYIETDEVKQTALEHYTSSTAVRTGILPTTEDRILTLSTCMGTGRYETRWVVQAVLTEEISR